MCVGAAHMLRTDTHGEARADLLAGREHDPLAVRLALMSFPSGQPADLTASVLTGRARPSGTGSGGWPDGPSNPPGRYRRTWRRRSGPPSVISTFRRRSRCSGAWRRRQRPARAKFETFLYVDRVLGLDLPRHIGKLR